LPRRDGFWQVGSKISFSGDKKEEFVWLAPLGKQIPIHKLSEKEAESLPEREVMAQPIQFLTPDYIGLAKAQYEHLESVYTYKTDEPDFQHALDISTVLGPSGEKALADKIEKPQDLIGGVPVSMQGNCNLDVPAVNWGVVREQGHWSVEGWGIWTDIKCSETIPLFRTSLRAPAKVIGFDELLLLGNRLPKPFPKPQTHLGRRHGDS
jgi:hypothetical protein